VQKPYNFKKAKSRKTLLKCCTLPNCVQRL